MVYLTSTCWPQERHTFLLPDVTEETGFPQAGHAFQPGCMSAPQETQFDSQVDMALPHTGHAFHPG